MAMISADFEQRSATIKGEYAESIVQAWLEAKGYVVYFPFTKRRPHWIDMIATYHTEKLIALDVKAKARMNIGMTGINERAWVQYQAFQEKYRVPVKLVFVDEHPAEERVYGNDLVALGTPDKIAPWGTGGANIVVWEVEKMVSMFPLSEAQLQRLRELSGRNYDYL